MPAGSAPWRWRRPPRWWRSSPSRPGSGSPGSRATEARPRRASPGSSATLATSLFLLSTQSGLLTVASVLTSLYPASTVLLAALLLHERIHRSQGVGLLLAGAAVALVAAG